MTGAISPQVADWNGDSLKDLLVGDGKGNINYFQRLPNGKLTEKPDISANGTIIDVGSISAPVIADWNNDGLLDLIVGVTHIAYLGKEIRIYLNSGTVDNPLLTDYDILFCGNDTIKLPHVEPEVADMDLDGLNDLLVCGYYSEVYFYKNFGSAQNPVFLTKELLDLSSGYPAGPNRNICVYDWDRNGAPDILYGVSDGCVYRFMNNTPVKIGKNTTSSQLLKNMKVSVFSNSIKVYLPVNSPYITIKLFNSIGREISTKNRSYLKNDKRIIFINRKYLYPGVYILRCNVGKENASAKIVLF